MSWEDLSVQIAGAALFIAALRNEAMPARGAFRSGAGSIPFSLRQQSQSCVPAQGCFEKRGWE